MIFGIIRLVIGCIFFVVIFAVLKSKKRQISQRKNRIKISAVVAIFLTTVLFFIPFDNLFFNFKTPESAYRYSQVGTPEQTVYGENSAMIIADNFGTNNLSIILKDDKSDSWKISLGYDTVILAQALNNGNSATVYHHKSTGDDYIFVYTSASQAFLNDEQGTEFIEISDKNAPAKEYVAFIADFDSEYVVTVNGIELTFK